LASRLTNSGQGVAEGFLDVLAERRRAADEEASQQLQGMLRGQLQDKAFGQQAAMADLSSRLQVGEQIGREQRAQAQDTTRAQGLADVLRMQAMPVAGVQAEHELADPKLSRLADVVPHLDPGTRGKVATDALIGDDKPISLPAGGMLVNRTGNQLAYNPKDTTDTVAKQPYIDTLVLQHQEAKRRGDTAAMADLEDRISAQKLTPIAEGGQAVNVFGRTVAQGPPKTQPLPAGQTESLAEGRNFLGMMDEVERTFDPKLVGPIAGRVGNLKSMTGIGANEAEAQMRAVLGSLENQLLRARSGQAVTPQEYDRIRRELPQVVDPPIVFQTKLKVARALMEEAIRTKEAEFSTRGFRGGMTAPPPSPPLVPPEVTKGAKPVNPGGKATAPAAPSAPPGPSSSGPSRDVVKNVAQQIFPNVPFIQIIRDPKMFNDLMDEVDRRTQVAR
jgi:hypothetical protein